MKTLIHLFILLYVLATPLKGQAQTDSTKKSNDNWHYSSYYPGATISLQALRHQSINLGFGVQHLTGMCEGLGKGIIINNEFVFKNEKGQMLYMPQLTLYCNIPYIYVGLNTIYATNFKNGGQLAISPEVGIGFFYFYITYSRNLIIIDNPSLPINKDNLSLKILIPFY